VQLGNDMFHLLKSGSNKYGKRFYEIDASKRCAGSRLAPTHKLSLNMTSITSEDAVLEVGCGGGALLSEISLKGAVAVGLDISEMQIKYAKTRLQGALLIIGDSERLPLKDNLFTKCFAVEMLEHVQNPGQVMKEIRRVLKDSAELIIVVPNDKNWFIHRFVQGYFREAFYDYGHLHDFSSLEKLKPLLEGFNILTVRENNVLTMPIRGLISQLLQGFDEILKRRRNNSILAKDQQEDTHTRLLTYEEPFLFIAPKLTLHLIIKLKKK